MSSRYIQDIPPGTPIHFGERGGEYILAEDNRRIYISRGPKPTRKPRPKFNPKRDAFLRFIENQATIS